MIPNPPYTKIDPHTGCVVLSTVGFFAAEAEASGKAAAEGMADFFAEMDAEKVAESARLLQHYRANPAALIAEMGKAEIEDPEQVDDAPVDWETDTPPNPVVEILAVDMADCDFSFREGSTETVTGRLRLADGRERYFRFVAWDFGGSWDEPPDGGETLIISVAPLPLRATKGGQ